jgi:hypothetical protein
MGKADDSDSGSDGAADSKDGVPFEITPVVDKPAKAPEKKAVAKAATVVWGAETKDFSTRYYLDSKSLRINFKIYNRSAPKEILSGRCVVVLKHKDDPPVKWISLPRVLLTDGIPVGDTGYAFRIKNYRTIRLTARNLKAPVEFNTASIYIFLSNGSRVYHRDYAFSIAPPAPVTPPKPKPAPGRQTDRPVQPASPTALQQDSSTQQKKNISGDPASALGQSLVPVSSAQAMPPVTQSSTIDPPASNASPGPKLEGEAQ